MDELQSLEKLQWTWPNLNFEVHWMLRIIQFYGMFSLIYQRVPALACVNMLQRKAAVEIFFLQNRLSTASNDTKFYLRALPEHASLSD